MLLDDFVKFPTSKNSRKCLVIGLGLGSGLRLGIQLGLGLRLVVRLGLALD